jgi:hypothetical protein
MRFGSNAVRAAWLAPGLEKPHPSARPLGLGSFCPWADILTKYSGG